MLCFVKVGRFLFFQANTNSNVLNISNTVISRRIFETFLAFCHFSFRLNVELHVFYTQQEQKRNGVSSECIR
jgi:hypothetical protein